MARWNGSFGAEDGAGKVGKVPVFYIRKGVFCVRKRVIPHNPKSEDQTVTRAKMGAIGRITGAVNRSSENLVPLFNSLAEGGQTWNNALSKYISGKNFANMTAAEAAYTSNKTVYDAAGATVKWLPISLTDSEGTTTTISVGQLMAYVYYASYIANESDATAAPASVDAEGLATYISNNLKTA